MKYYKTIVSLFLLIMLAIIGSKALFQETTERSKKHASVEKVLDYARQNLPLEGKLTRKSDGFVYLKVDDAYIHTLLPKLGLDTQGFREPPFFRSPEGPGAHITVFYENEHIVPEELGQTFHFELKDIRIVRSKYASYAVLDVTSPELEQLRKKYSSKGKLHGHGFHISLGKKREARDNKIKDEND